MDTEPGLVAVGTALCSPSNISFVLILIGQPTMPEVSLVGGVRCPERTESALRNRPGGTGEAVPDRAQAIVTSGSR